MMHGVNMEVIEVKEDYIILYDAKQDTYYKFPRDLLVMLEDTTTGQKLMALNEKDTDLSKYEMRFN